MNSNRKAAIIVGVLFIIGTVAGVLSVGFLNPILGDPDYLIKVTENRNQVITGALLVLTMGLALAMVPVMMFSIFKKHNETLALGYVVFRGGLETVTYIAQVISLLILLLLSQEYVKAEASDASHFPTLGTLLLGAKESSINLTIIVFSLGALMFYYLLYQSKLIPRWLSGWGLIAIILHLPTAFLVMFGLSSTMSTILVVMNLPIFFQEMVMAVWLIVKGFNPSAIAFEFVKPI